jgi:hypothetical protein
MDGQEAQGGKFLPAFFVEPVELGDEFPRGEWPLHMTYFPPVRAQFTAGHAEQLRRFVNPIEPFMATVGEDDMFGPNRDVPVRLMVPSERLQAVHRRILAVFQELPHSTQFRMPYRPHVAIKSDDQRVQEGDEIEVGGFSIVERPGNSNTWQVIAKIGLKGAAMQTDARLIKHSERIL